MTDKNAKAEVNTAFRIALFALAGSYIYATHASIRHNYGIMLLPIIDSSSVSFADVSFILAVGQLVFGLVQPAFGILSARKGPIYALASGVVLTVAGLLLTPLCRSTMTLMLCLGIILPAGSGAISYGIIMGVITPKIPPGSVPSVSGIVNASIGVGNTVMSPVINALIRSGGLMYSMLVLTVPIALTLPVSLLMTRKEGRPTQGVVGAASRVPSASVQGM